MLSVHNETPLTKHSYYRRPQFHVQDNHPIYGSRPYTQQSRGCGQPGDYVGLPFNFLTTWNNTWENFGDPAKLFVKEWAKLRYGTFDELGFEGKITIKRCFFIQVGVAALLRMPHPLTLLILEALY